MEIKKVKVLPQVLNNQFIKKLSDIYTTRIRSP